MNQLDQDILSFLLYASYIFTLFCQSDEEGRRTNGIPIERLREEESNYMSLTLRVKNPENTTFSFFLV